VPTIFFFHNYPILWRARKLRRHTVLGTGQNISGFFFAEADIDKNCCGCQKILLIVLSL
jgi:hypothetical protein